MTRARSCLAALALAAAAPAASSAQAPLPPASRALGLTFGVADFHQRDEYLAPATYAGAMLAAGIGYERRGARTLLDVEAAATFGRTDSPTLPRDVHQYTGRVAVTLLRALGAAGDTGRRLRLYAGGGLTALASVTDFKTRDLAYGGTSYGDASWYWSRSLDLVARAEYRLGRRAVALQLSVPALRLVSRPETGKFFPGGKPRVAASVLGAVVAGSPEAPWENPVLFGRAEVRQGLGGGGGGGLVLRAVYDFSYVSSDRPLPLGMYCNAFQVGVLWPL